ncbi:MAG: TlpA disulfide reductase family protein [Desulfomonilaceae bacterium]|nr:TlpA disulfide reductase family protein [Desulfomonilaceae bacterium]
MYTNTVLVTLIAICAPVLLTVGSVAADQTDPVAQANIFLYPKPYKVADMTLKSPSGQTVSLSGYRGRVVLLHFWSINCPACRLEEPLLQELKRSLGHTGLEILAVNLVDPPVQVANHAFAHNTPFPVLFDGGGGFDLKVVNMAGKKTAFVVNPDQEAILEVPGFPTTYIVDATGNAVGYSVGPARWNNGAVVALLRNLVRQGGAYGPRAQMPGHQGPSAVR